MPAMTFANVLLPPPLGPVNATNRSLIVRLTSCRISFRSPLPCSLSAKKDICCNSSNAPITLNVLLCKPPAALSFRPVASRAFYLSDKGATRHNALLCPILSIVSTPYLSLYDAGRRGAYSSFFSIPYLSPFCQIIIPEKQ